MKKISALTLALFMILGFPGSPTIATAEDTTHQSTRGVELLRQFYARTATLQSAFTQKVIDEKGTVTDNMSGQFWMSRPATFRWEYRHPYEQIMVNDGKKLWMYDVDLAQVTVRDAAQALAGAPVWLLNGGPTLEEQFLLESEESQNGINWVRMTPRNAENDFKLARMGLSQGLPVILELTDALGQRTVINFENMSSNIVIPADRFRFTPPADVEVVEG